MFKKYKSFKEDYEMRVLKRIKTWKDGIKENLIKEKKNCFIGKALYKKVDNKKEKKDCFIN